MTVKHSVSEAASKLKFKEMFAIEKHFERNWDDLSTIQRGAGLYWAYKNREGPYGWDSIDEASNEDMSNYFEVDSVSSGKDSGENATPPTS